MRVLRISRLAVAALLAVVVLATPGQAAPGVVIARNLPLEFVGVVINSPAGATPISSVQFGYFTYVLGLPIFKGNPENESTALFTFYIDTTTLRVITHGPLRVVSREGTMTIYRNPAAGGAFDNPDSLRQGAPVLVAHFRQQVVNDAITGMFTTHNLNQIGTTRPFPAGKRALQLGVVGARFETVIHGHQTMPGPPSAYIAGYTFSRP
jgi:hypothetical protein